MLKFSYPSDFHGCHRKLRSISHQVLQLMEPGKGHLCSHAPALLDRSKEGSTPWACVSLATSPVPELLTTGGGAGEHWVDEGDLPG